MQNLKKDNKLIYKTEIDSQTYRMNLELPREKGGERGIVWEFVIDMHTLLLIKTDNQQRPTIWQKELCSMLCGRLYGRGVWGRMDTRLSYG